MTNNLTNCPDCGASYAMVGKVHRCRGAKPAVDPAPVMAAPVSVTGGGKYKYRDADKWRSYMREYMRKRRHPA